MKVTLPVAYSQQDPQWSKALLGYNQNPQFDLANYGCLVTCLAMVARYFGKDENPTSMNDHLKNLPDSLGFKDGGFYVHGGITKVYGDISEKVTNTPKALTDDQIAEIKASIDRDMPVMIQIDYNPKTVKPDTHYVVIVDYNPTDENDFTIVDPLGGKTESLKKYLAWFKPSVRATIEQYYIYEGPIQPKDTQPTPESITPVEPSPQISTSGPGVIPDGYFLCKIDDNERNVKKATQYDRTVEYLELEKAPNDAMFEDVRRVIAGLKSRITDLQNQKEAAEKAKAAAEVHADVLEKENGTLRLDMTRAELSHKAEVDALKVSTKTPDNLKKVYDSNLEAVKTERDSAIGEVRTLRIEIAEKNIEEGSNSKKGAQTGVGFNSDIKADSKLIKKLLSWFIKFEE